MTPIVDGLEQEYSGRVAIVRLNTDDPANAEAESVYQSRYQPYYVLLDRDGQVVESWLSRQEKEAFDAAFAAIVGQ